MITGVLRHWCERGEIDGYFRKFIDLIAREELVVSCDRELKLWIQEQKPMIVDELMKRLKLFNKHTEVFKVSYRAQSSSKPNNDFQNRYRGMNTQQQKIVDTRTCFVCNRTGHIATDCPMKRSSQNTSREITKQGKFGLCISKSEEALRNEVQMADGFISGVTLNLTWISCSGNKIKTKVHGLDIVEGRIKNEQISVLRDRGCSTVLIHSKRTNPNDFTGFTREICLADGTVKKFSEIRINITTPFISGDILALVLNTPFADLIVSNYINTSVPAEYPQSVESEEQKSTDTSDCNISGESIDPCHAVQIRSQKIKHNTVDVGADKYSTDTPLTKPIDISEVCK
jgi:hypothetical protein